MRKNKLHPVGKMDTGYHPEYVLKSKVSPSGNTITSWYEPKKRGKKENIFKGEIDDVTITLGDKGWVKEDGKLVHRIITYTKKEGVKSYKDGKLETPQPKQECGHGFANCDICKGGQHNQWCNHPTPQSREWEDQLQGIFDGNFELNVSDTDKHPNCKYILTCGELADFKKELTSFISELLEKERAYVGKNKRQAYQLGVNEQRQHILQLIKKKLKPFMKDMRGTVRVLEEYGLYNSAKELTENLDYLNQVLGDDLLQTIGGE